MDCRLRSVAASIARCLTDRRGIEPAGAQGNPPQQPAVLA